MTSIGTGAQILRRHVHRLRRAEAISAGHSSDLIHKLNDIQWELEEAASVLDEEDVELVAEDDEVMIPDGKVVKFTFDVSHAPHYVMQLDNGLLVGVFAKVESAAGTERTAFGASKEKFKENMASDHVTTSVIDKSNSPFQTQS